MSEEVSRVETNDIKVDDTKMNDTKVNDTKLCISCMREHAEKMITRSENMKFKNRDVTYEAKYYYCDETEEYWADEALMRYNDIAMKNAYRKDANLLTTNEIIDIRKKYGVTQTDFCHILGWGAKTIARYETHQIQSRAHDNVLRKIGNDPEWFLELLEVSKDTISQRNYGIYKEIAEKEYSKQVKVHLGKVYPQIREGVSLQKIKPNMYHKGFVKYKSNRKPL